MLQQGSALRVKCVVSGRRYSAGRLSLTLCLEALLLQRGRLNPSLQSTGGEVDSLTASFSASCVLLLPAGPAAGEAAAVTSHIDFFLCRLFSLRKITCIAGASSKWSCLFQWHPSAHHLRGCTGVPLSVTVAKK